MLKSLGRKRLECFFVLLVAGLLVSAVSGSVIVVWLYVRPTPEKALTQIEREDTEDTRLDPLILAGHPAEIYVLMAVKNRTLKGRIDAITFLGNQRTAMAAPVLQSLVQDDSETSEIRAAALEALAQVDDREGRLLAEKYKDADFSLALTARRVLMHALPPQRTFIEALIGCHDCF